MKHFLCGLLLFLLAVGANAQRKADEEAVRRLPQAFSDAWAKHDGHELAKIMADDVDFVTVATTYLHGRADFEKFHTRLLSGALRKPASRRSRRPRDFSGLIWRWSIGAGELKETRTPMARPVYRGLA